MEQRVTLSCRRGGFILITVLVITAIGLLFGAGALLLFKFQCQLRIDRQHELEKVYAVRSALNYTSNFAEEIELTGTSFGYHTRSGRDLNLFVKPVDRIFPNLRNPEHLDIRDDGKDIRGEEEDPRYFSLDSDEVTDQRSSIPDYEFGRSGTTNSIFGISNEYGKMKGLLFSDYLACRGAKWWVNIGMPGIGGWLHEKYGRRYFVEPRNYVAGEKTNDIMRLCIIRSVTNSVNNVGCRYGWPLSREGERAIVLEFRPMGAVSDAANAVIRLYECVYLASPSITDKEDNLEDKEDNLDWTLLDEWSNEIYAINMYVGVQIAGDRVVVFQSQKVAGSTDKMLRGWRFSPKIAKLSSDTYRYFEKGCVKDVEGEIVESPDLRAVLEIEANADSRPTEDSQVNVEQGSEGGLKFSNINNFLTDFRVTPAYQFDVFLEHPISYTNLATVAQRVILKDSQGGGHKLAEYTVRTYDTHGTENKGFRKDEKLARENKGRTQ